MEMKNENLKEMILKLTQKDIDELMEKTEKVSYLLRSLVFPYSFWLVHNSHYWIRLASTPLLLSVYYI